MMSSWGLFVVMALLVGVLAVVFAGFSALMLFGMTFKNTAESLRPFSRAVSASVTLGTTLWLAKIKFALTAVDSIRKVARPIGDPRLNPATLHRLYFPGKALLYPRFSSVVTLRDRSWNSGEFESSNSGTKGL